MQERIKKILSEQQFISPVLNSFSIDMVLFDPNHNYTYINPNAISNKETREWLIGKNDFDYCKHKGIDDTLAKQRREYFNKCIESKSDYEWIDKYTTEKGEEQYILRKFHPVFENDKLVYVMGYGIDVSTLKKAEKKAQAIKDKYEKIIQNMSDGLVVDGRDNSGDIIYCNKRFQEIFGYTEEEANNLKLQDYISPEYHKEQRERHNKRINGENVATFFECEGIKKTGERIWLQVRVTPIVENNIIVGTQSLIADITEKKAKELELSRLNQELANIEEAERERIASELHDSVSQKLVALKLFLRSARNDSDIQNIDTLITDTIQEVRTISNNLLPKELHNTGFINAIDNLLSQLPSVKIRVQFTYSNELKKLVVEKHIKFNIYRIIQENINNIIKHSKASSVKVDIKKNKNSILINIFNNGNAISDTVLRDPLSFIAIKRRVNILKGSFTISKNEKNNVEFEYEIPFSIATPVLSIKPDHSFNPGNKNQINFLG